MSEMGVERTLGVILGKLEGIDGRLESAEHSRKEMYGRMDGYTLEVIKVRQEVEGLSERIGDVEAKVESLAVVVARVENYERDSKRAWSALLWSGSKIGGIIRWAVLTGIVAAAAMWERIVSVIWPPPGH